MLQVQCHRLNQRFHVAANLLTQGVTKLASELRHPDLHVWVLVLACSPKHHAQRTKMKGKLLRGSFQTDFK